MLKVFIDGREGTTGLQLETRLERHPGVHLLDIDPALRKDEEARRALMEQADAVFLCLPDAAAREAVTLCPPDTLLLDASTAHRVTPGWTYGLPELCPAQRYALTCARRIAVPGCHATGFLLLVSPLIQAGLLPHDALLSCTSLTGYSGGGKSLIARYEEGRDTREPLSAPRPYALGLTHKHLPEMQGVPGLATPPHFYPVVGDMAQGMLVSVPLWQTQLGVVNAAQAALDCLQTHYRDSRFVHVCPSEEAPLDGGFLDPTARNNTTDVDLFVFGHETQTLLVARFDNLGKGASGAAVQCFNLAAGFAEDTGL